MDDAAGSAGRLGDIFGSQPWIDELVRSHPGVAEGLGRLTAVAALDGAIPGRIKLLYMAAIATAQRDTGLARVLLGGAVEGGLTAAEARGAAAALLVSRGVPVLSAFLGVVTEVTGPATAGPGEDAADEETSATEYVESVYGAVPERIRIMGEHLPEALDGFHRLRSTGLRGAGLEAKWTELLLVALNAALLEPGFVASHASDARDEGASEAELAEAAAVAIPLAGMAAWHAGATGIAESRRRGSRRSGG